MWKGLCYLDEDLAIINEVNGRPVTTLNQSTYYVTNGAQRWVIQVALEPASIRPLNPENTIGAAFAGILGANFADELIMLMPQVVDQGVVNVAGTAIAGATSIALSRRVTFAVGRFIKFANHSKVYLVMASPGPTLTIYPKLHKSITRSAIDINPNLHGRQIQDVLGITIRRKLISPRIRLAEIIEQG